ncbi:MAG: hypothetical protein J0M26_20290 [Planctomycetes bacterium]|nr:hypothetical protein [Planctomycetota bacterium]
MRSYRSLYALVFFAALVILMQQNLYSSAGNHPAEPPELMPHEHWFPRGCWIAVGAIIVFVVTYLLNYLAKKLETIQKEDDNMDLDSRWCNTGGNVVLDIPASISDGCRLCYMGDDLLLKVTSCQSEHTDEVPAGKDALLLFEGEMTCFASKYPTGTFTVSKQKGRLNDLNLKLTFQDGRQADVHLKRA